MHSQAERPDESHMVQEIHDINLNLAGTVYRVKGIPGQWLQYLPPKLNNWKTDASAPGASIYIELEKKDRLEPPREAYDINEVSTLKFEPEEIHFHSVWCEGSLSLAPEMEMRLFCHPHGGPYFAGMLENALRLMVAYHVLAKGGLLIHSAGLVRNGAAYLLFGHSGAGKSTSSDLALEQRWGVISDDINVILPESTGWRVFKVPFCGTVEQDSGKGQTYSLAGIYRLQKDTGTKLRSCSRATSIALLCGSVPFINQDPYRSDQLMETLTTLAAQYQVQYLHFDKSPRFLAMLEQETSKP